MAAARIALRERRGDEPAVARVQHESVRGTAHSVPARYILNVPDEEGVPRHQHRRERGGSRPAPVQICLFQLWLHPRHGRAVYRPLYVKGKGPQEKGQGCAKSKQKGACNRPNGTTTPHHRRHLLNNLLKILYKQYKDYFFQNITLFIQ